jgi:peroxiredoxin
MKKSMHGVLILLGLGWILAFQALPVQAGLPVGSQAPAFTLTTTTDKTISLSDFAGKTVILHFWKSN